MGIWDLPVTMVVGYALGITEVRPDAEYLSHWPVEAIFWPGLEKAVHAAQ